MIKINFLSDIHLEFLGYKWHLSETNADLIILNGDIGSGLRTYEWAIRESERLDKTILMVLGNHEYYNEDFTLSNRAKEYVKGTNVHVLEKDVFEYRGYKIFGTTLWTDYNLYGEPMQKIAMKAASDFISDHKLITYENRAFTPEDALLEHKVSMIWLNSGLQTTAPKIVVTHHAPTFHAGHPMFRGDMCTPAFCSDLEGFIIERKPLLWLSGHSHHVYRKQIGDTLCMSNTKGYKNEGILHFDPELIVEV